MNVEQRLAALEAELAELKGQKPDKKSLSKLVQKITSETIKNSLRPGGLLHRSEKAALSKAAGSIHLSEKNTIVKDAAGITRLSY